MAFHKEYMSIVLQAVSSSPLRLLVSYWVAYLSFPTAMICVWFSHSVMGTQERDNLQRNYSRLLNLESLDCLIGQVVINSTVYVMFMQRGWEVYTTSFVLPFYSSTQGFWNETALHPSSEGLLEQYCFQIILGEKILYFKKKLWWKVLRYKWEYCYRYTIQRCSHPEDFISEGIIRLVWNVCR